MSTELVTGRQNLIERALTDPSRLIILVGDSGVGKSTVLEAIQRKSASIGPEYVRLEGRTGTALTESVLEYLRIAADKFLADNGEDAFRSRVTRTAGFFRVGIRKQIGTTGFEMLSSAVEARYGKEAAKLVVTLKEAVIAGGSNIPRRLAGLDATDTLTAAFKLAEELATLSGLPLCLALDDLHLASTEELARLGQIANRLPPTITIFGTFTAQNETQKQRLITATGSSLSLHQVDGLSISDVEYLLLVAKLSSDRAAAIRRITEGYGLHIQAAIQLLRTGQTAADLETLDKAGIIGASVRDAMRQLDRQDQLIARRLSAHPFPISPSRITNLTGCDALDWMQVRQALIDSGLFLDRPDVPWFHELKRQALWDQLDREAQRAVANTTVDEILDGPDRTTGDIVTLSNTIELASASLAARPDIGPILGLRGSGVAVAAAILELCDLSNPASEGRFADVDQVFLHCRRLDSSFDVDILSTALDELERLELIVVASDERAAVTAPRWSAHQAMTIAARAHQTFGRICHPDISTFLFYALAPYVAKFARARYGVGYPSVASMSESAQVLSSFNEDGSRHIGAPARPALLVRAKLGELWWNASISYTNVALARAASESLTNLELQIGDDSLRVTTVLQHPLSQVCSRRLIAALEAALGESLGDGHTAGGLKPGTFPDLKTMTIESAMAETATLHTFIATQFSTPEQVAFDVEQPKALFYKHKVLANTDGDPTYSTFVARVSGMRGTHDVPGEMPSMRTKYLYAKLAKALALSPEQRVLDVHSSWGVTPISPVADEVERLSKDAAAFNSAQDSMVLPMDQEKLQSLLSAAVARQWMDGLALSRLLRVLNPAEPNPAQMFVRYFDLEPDDWQWRTVGVEIIEVEAQSPTPSVIVMKGSENERAKNDDLDHEWRRPPAWVLAHPLYEGGSARRRSSGGVGLIERLLGFFPGELDTRPWMRDFQPLMRLSGDQAVKMGPELTLDVYN